MPWFSIATVDGPFLARYSANGLAELRFPTVDSPATSDVSESIDEWHTLTAAAVSSLLAGETPERLPPLDLSGHTPFRVRVWEQLLRIPLGQTATYSQIAVRLGESGATRAVGGACGANPIPLIIPCHRVLAAGGKLGGFSGGLHWKRKLLAAEGINPESRQEHFEFASKRTF
jgi:O-6-methylguanine DNA methyltransferase